MKGRICSLVAAALACACTARPSVSDTGFVGTWARSGAIGGYRSIVSILKDGDRWLFRWKLDTEDGTWKVRCDWSGRCEEFVDEKRIGTYTFHVREEPGQDFLSVDCVREDLREGRNGYHYRDELVLNPGGLSVTTYTLELNGTLYPRESARKLTLEKISNTVADPPPGFGS